MTPQIKGRSARKRGRPRVNSLTIKVRVSPEAYDKYCTVANHQDRSVRSVMRSVLELHAPTIIFCGPKIAAN